MSKVIKVGATSDVRVGTALARASQMLEQFAEPVGSRADEVLEKAYAQADVITRTARSEATAIQEEAYSAGYNAGLRQGARAADALIGRLEQDVAAAEEERARLLELVEHDVLMLCLEAVEKIVRHEIKTDQRVVVRMIKSCLRRIKDREPVDVRVSQQEVEFVRSQRDELLSLVEGARGLTISDDRRISPGGCVLESASGTVDARIETQVEQIRSKLMETYENGHRQTTSGPEQLPEGDQPA